MMKMPRAWAVCVRRSNGEIVSREGEVVSWSQRFPVLKLPVLRGVAVLGQMMGLGMRSLFFSSDIAAEDAERSDAPASSKIAAVPKTLITLASLLVLNAVASGPDGTETDEEASAAAPEATSTKAEKKGAFSGLEMAFSIGLAVVLFIGVFKALPLGLAWLAGRAFPVLANPFAENLVSGVALAGLFVGYLWLMSRFKDMRRVFQYHGAEHEVVHVHEKGLPWTVDAARVQPTEHPRCGTSFLFFVVLTSIVVWSLFPLHIGFLAKLGLRILLLPLIVGLAFELIRLSARHRTNPFFRALMAPGLWSQRITTKQPDDSMLDVSLQAFRLTADRSGVAEPATT
jgi:uncharacterized protein YqhQ